MFSPDFTAIVEEKGIELLREALFSIHTEMEVLGTTDLWRFSAFKDFYRLQDELVEATVKE